MVLPTMVLLDPVVEIVQDLLVDQGLGTLGGGGGAWPIFAANLPDVPDNCIAVFESAPILQGRYHIGGAYKERPGFNVQVRSHTYRTGDVKARGIYTALIEALAIPYDLTTVTSNSYRIHSVSRASGPFSLGKTIQDSKRYAFSLNFTMSMVPI